MTIHNNYIVRTPVLNREYIHKVFQTNNLEGYILSIINTDDGFMERILVASNNLYEQLIEVKNGKKLEKDVVISVVKYMLRMSSRPMPYGLFASIGEKDFLSNNQEPSVTYKDVRVSMEWLNSLSKEIEQAQTASSHLMLYKNSSLREISDAFYLDSAINNNRTRLNLKKSNFIDFLMSSLEAPKTISEIISLLSDGDYSKEERILDAIKHLLKINMLVSHLRPESSIDNRENKYGLNNLLCEQDLIDTELYTEIKGLQNLLDIYKGKEIGDGIEIYRELTRKMKKICKSERYIIVDLISFNPDQYVEKSVIEEFILHTNFLSSFNAFTTIQKVWDRYVIEFLDEYGLYNEIGLLDLIDEDTGIGSPDFIQSLLLGTHEIEDKYNEFLLNVIQNALISGEDKITFTDDDILYINDLIQYKGSNHIQDGYDVKVNVIKESGYEKVVLSENSFGNTSKSFSGRFNLYKNRHRKPLFYNTDDYISAEVNVVPNNYSDLGITYQHNNFRISINTHTSTKEAVHIPLTDLVVGLDQGGLYIKSKSIGKKILPVFSHMLFYSNFNEDVALLFLHQFGKYISNTPCDFHLGIANKLNYIPRIEYNNQFILSLKRWNIRKDAMYKEIKNSGISKREYLTKYFEKYQIDPIVNMLKGDMTLPIHVFTQLGMDLILREMKSPQSQGLVTLIEAPELNEENTSSKNVDFIITVPPKNNVNDYLITPVENDIGLNGVVDFSWAYYHIYYRKEDRIKLIRKCIEWLEKEGIRKYFVVSYSDTSKHIRLRFQHHHKESQYRFTTFLQSLFNNKKIKKYSKENFFPEYSRYGGQELCNIAHELFCYDTKFLYSHSTHFKQHSKLEQGVMICLYTVMDLFKTYHEALLFLNELRNKKNKEVLKGFNTDRQHYINIATKMLFSYDRQDELLYKKRKLARKYCNQVKQTFNEERQFYILKSIVHMSMNRFIGINREIENKAYELASYTLYNLKYVLDMKGGYYELL
ncbi:thiopeptide-type bacteriocin biosynthesis protein [Cytobacillus sp. Hm23]